MNTQDGLPGDPLADDEYWRYKIRCRNCEAATEYVVGKAMGWHDFYTVTADRLTSWVVCENCGAFAVHDLVAMSGRPE